MRILHVIYSLSLKFGGPPEGLRQLAAAYMQNNVELEVATLDDPSEAFLEELPFKVHALGPVKSVYGRSMPLRDWLSNNIKRFDGIVINGVWQYPGLAAYKAAKNNIPYVVFTHGALDPWFKRKYPLKHLKKSAYWYLFQYPVLRDALAVLFTTKTEKEQALLSFKRNQWNGVVVPYGTNRPKGNREAQAQAFYDRCPELRGKQYFLYMSRIHEKKGCDLLIDAFSRVAHSTDLYLVMAGPDQVGLKASLIQQAKQAGVEDRIVWPGLLEKDAKWGAFYNAEVFVLPSHQENFGIAVAEALACGIPVLISDKVNIWEDIVEDRAGFVEEDTSEGTYNLLARWLKTSEDERHAMVENALQCFDKRYSMSEAAKAIKAMFQRTDTTLG